MLTNLKPLSVVSIAIMFFLSVSSVSCKKPEDDKDDKDDKVTEDKKTEEPTTGSLAINNVQNLTDPVKEFAATDTSTEATESREFDSAGTLVISMLATNGVSLGGKATAIDGEFDTVQTTSGNASKAFCETVNQGMKFFFEAANADFMKCVISVVAGDDSTLSNGSYHVHQINIASQGSYKFKFKMSATDSVNTEFESFSCAGQGNEFRQENYVHHKVTDGKMVYLSKMKHFDDNDPDMNGTYQLDASSTVNSEGNYVGLKKMKYKGGQSAGGRHHSSTMVQSANNILYTGYESSTGPGGRSGDPRVTKYYSFSELIDKNTADSSGYYATKMAYGDGAALITVTESGSTQESTQAWNGDSKEKVNSSDRLEFVTGKNDSLPSDTDTASAPVIAFSAAETWDCSDAVDETFDKKMEVFSDCMERYEIDQEGSSMCNDLNY